MKAAFFIFALCFVVFSYTDAILLGEIKRFENAVLAGIMAGLFIAVRLLHAKQRKP